MALVCLSCRGQGEPGGCSNCGKDSLASATPVVEVSTELLVQRQIPPQYLSVEWDADQLMATHSNLKGNNSFQFYCKVLTNMINQLKTGNLPSQSVLLMADRGFGKRTFAYCYMKECMKLGLSVAPIIDTTQYRRLNRISSERPFDKSIVGLPYSIEDINASDVLVLTVDPENYRSALTVLDTVCDKRSRSGKPTLITSRFNVREMALWDYSGKDPETFLAKLGTTDKMKYPTPVMITEIRKGI